MEDLYVPLSVAVVSQIVFVWLAAAAIVLPGIVGLLPVVIGWSDQLSRCNFDRATSYGALSVVFCAGFIVPCVVIGYCYGMIWRRTREVRLRVDGYSALRLTRTRLHNGASVFAASPSTPVPSNTNVVAHDTLRSEPLLRSGDNHQLVAEDDKAGSTYGSGKWCIMECSQGTVADCRDRLLPVVQNQDITVDIDRPQMEIPEVEETIDESGVAQWNKHENIGTCSGCNNDSSADDKNNDHIEQTNADNSRRRVITSDDCQQLATLSPPAFDSRKPTKSSSALSISSRSTTSDVAEREKDASDDHVMLGNNDQLTADNEPHQLPARSQTLKHDSISVVITPAAATNSAADVLRESSTSVVASEVINKSGGI